MTYDLPLSGGRRSYLRRLQAPSLITALYRREGSPDMVRLCGRGPGGKRVIDEVPQRTWKTIIFAGMTRWSHPMVLDGAMMAVSAGQAAD
jgi:hypothetical protein